MVPVANGDLNPVDGSDFTERTLVDNVTAFRVERLPRGDNRADLVDITLTLGTGSRALTVQTRVPVGGAT